jgi:hypothetical protein
MMPEEFLQHAVVLNRLTGWEARMSKNRADLFTYLALPDNRVGGRNRETTIKPDPGGGRATACRYAWDRPSWLVPTMER